MTMKSKIWRTGLVVGLLASGAAQATLHDRGGGLIYDDFFGITWLRDANYAQTSGYSGTGQMDWSAANTWAANLVYHDTVRNVDYSNWRLPTSMNQDGPEPCTGYNCTGSEMGHLFYTDGGLSAWDQITSSSLLNSLFVDMQSSAYWSGTAGFYFETYRGNQWATFTQDYTLYAWAVRDGDVAAAAPEPATLALALAGMGLAGLARRRSLP
jgi:hypothetical protein